MKRREFIENGIGIIGSYTIHSSSDPRPIQSKISGHQSAPLDSPASRVTIKPDRETPQVVPENHWIEHTFGYITCKEENPRNLQEMVNIPEYSFRLDGKTVKNSEQYWTDIRSLPDGRSHIKWKFALPPPALGIHTFSVSIDFPRPITNLQNDGTTKVWEGREDLKQRYKIIDFGIEGGGGDE